MARLGTWMGSTVKDHQSFRRLSLVSVQWGGSEEAACRRRGQPWASVHG